MKKLCIYKPCNQPHHLDSHFCREHALYMQQCTQHALDIRGKLLLNDREKPYCTQCKRTTNPHYKHHHVVLTCWSCGGRMAREIDEKADKFVKEIMAQYNPWRAERGMQLIDDEQARECFYIIENFSRYIRKNPIAK